MISVILDSSGSSKGFFLSILALFYYPGRTQGSETRGDSRRQTLPVLILKLKWLEAHLGVHPTLTHTLLEFCFRGPFPVTHCTPWEGDKRANCDAAAV